VPHEKEFPEGANIEKPPREFFIPLEAYLIPVVHKSSERGKRSWLEER